MEHRRQQAQEEIDQLMEKVGPDITDRVGRFLTAREQGEEPDVETMPAELRRDYARIFRLKAEIEGLKSSEATSEYSHEFHALAAKAFLAMGDLFALE